MGAIWTGCRPAAGHNRRLDCGEGCHSAGLRLYSVLNRIVLYRATLYLPMSEVSESYQVIRRGTPRHPHLTSSLFRKPLHAPLMRLLYYVACPATSYTVCLPRNDCSL